MSAPPPPPGWGPPGAGPPLPPGWGPPPSPPVWSGPPAWGPPPGPTGGTARTGPLPLGPMGLGEILDAAFKLYRANFKPIALVALAFTGPLSLLAAIAARSVNGGYGLLEIFRDPSLADKAGGFGGAGALAAQLASSLLLGISGTMVAGVVATAAAATYRGEELTSGQAVRTTARYFPALLAARILVWLSEGVGLLGCGVGAIAVMGLWVVVAPAIVVEGLGPLRGMGRSLRLCTGRYWPVLGTALLSGVIASSLSTVVSGVPSVLAGVIGYRWGFPLIAVGTTATAVLVAPLTAIVATLIYFDLRIRQEGLDLQIAAQGDRRGGSAA